MVSVQVCVFVCLFVQNKIYGFWLLHFRLFNEHKQDTFDIMIKPFQVFSFHSLYALFPKVLVMSIEHCVVGLATVAFYITYFICHLLAFCVDTVIQWNYESTRNWNLHFIKVTKYLSNWLRKQALFWILWNEV